MCCVGSVSVASCFVSPIDFALLECTISCSIPAKADMSGCCRSVGSVFVKVGVCRLFGDVCGRQPRFVSHLVRGSK